MNTSGQLAGYQQAQVYPSQAPKEIGVMDRLNGLRQQLFEINDMLSVHGARMEGSPPSKEEIGLSGPGLRAMLTDCEGAIRNIRAKIQVLHDIF